MKDLVSIIIPFKNAEKFLVALVNSIQKQTYANFEVIAVDDHSIDNSWAKFQSLTQLDDRFKFLKNRGGGIISALTTAEQEMKGSFITRMDADDSMAENRLKVLHQNLVKNGDDFVATGCVSYFSESKTIQEGYKNYELWLNELTKKGNNFTEIYRECTIPSPCWMLKISTFKKIGGFSASIYPEDYDLAFRMYKYGLKVVPEHRILHFWRDHNLRASRTDDNYSDNSFLPLKVKYFLDVDCRNAYNIAIWGAGKKAKKVVQILLENNIQPRWFCNNQQKIDKDIYGVRLENCKQLINEENQFQILVLVANPAENFEIQSKLNKAGKIKNQDYFCFV